MEPTASVADAGPKVDVSDASTQAAASAPDHGGSADAGPRVELSDAGSAASAPVQVMGSTVDAGAKSEAPDPSMVSVDIEGDEGCGPFAQNVSAAGMAYTALMQNVQLVRDTAGAEVRDIACTLTAHYKFPAGWALDTPSTIVRGYASTDESISLQLELSAGIEPGVLSNQRTFPASTGSDFALAIDDAAGMGVGSVCGDDSADIRVRVVASALGEGSALLQIDSVDGRITWRRCP